MLRLKRKGLLDENIILGYVEHEQGQEAMECFEMMHLEGAQPNAIAFPYMLKVCGSMQVAACK